MSEKITATMVNDLRKKTGVSLIHCKKALVEANGDMDVAMEELRKKGLATAAKKSDRAASEGIVESYIHLGGKVGVLLELNCETDFVAKNDDFKALARDIAMHIAAATPLYVSREQVPSDLVEKEKEIATGQAEGKPAQAIEKIVEGKLNKFYGETCLLEQDFIKDSGNKVQDVISQAIAKMGENIVVNKFSRFQIGG